MAGLSLPRWRGRSREVGHAALALRAWAWVGVEKPSASAGGRGTPPHARGSPAAPPPGWEGRAAGEPGLQAAEESLRRVVAAVALAVHGPGGPLRGIAARYGDWQTSPGGGRRAARPSAGRRTRRRHTHLGQQPRRDLPRAQRLACAPKRVQHHPRRDLRPARIGHRPRRLGPDRVQPYLGIDQAQRGVQMAEVRHHRVQLGAVALDQARQLGSLPHELADRERVALRHRQPCRFVVGLGYLPRYRDGRGR